MEFDDFGSNEADNDFADVDLDWAGYDWDRRHGYLGDEEVRTVRKRPGRQQAAPSQRETPGQRVKSATRIGCTALLLVVIFACLFLFVCQT